MNFEKQVYDEPFKIALDGRPIKKLGTGTTKRKLEIATQGEALDISIFKIPVIREDANNFAPFIPCYPDSVIDETTKKQLKDIGVDITEHLSLIYDQYVTMVDRYWEHAWQKGAFVEPVEMEKYEYLAYNEKTSQIHMILEKGNFYDIFIWKDTQLLKRGRISTVALMEEDPSRGIFRIIPDYLILEELKLLVLKDLSVSSVQAEGVKTVLTANISDKKEITAYFYLGETNTRNPYIITVDCYCKVIYHNHPKEAFYKFFRN